MNKLYHCPNCKAILCIQENQWFRKMVCPSCGVGMINLDESFDLSEILSEENKDE